MLGEGGFSIAPLVRRKSTITFAFLLGRTATCGVKCGVLFTVFFYLALFIPLAKLRLTTQKPIIKETTQTTAVGRGRQPSSFRGVRGEKKGVCVKKVYFGERRFAEMLSKRLFLPERGGIETPLARLCFLSPRNEKGNAPAA